jgi:lactate permease
VSEFAAGINALEVVAGALPIGALIWLMLVRGWGAARAGPVALLAALALAVVVFGADIRLLAFSQAKAALLTIWILGIVWGALFLYHLVDETGRIPLIGAWLAQLAPSRPFQVLILAWAFTSFLQGIAGYGVPVAVVAPLMVANGFAPAIAVIATSIGHSWSVTFGSLAASYFALAGVTGAGGFTLAVDSAITLGVACLLCGVGAVWAYGGYPALRSVWAPLLAAFIVMAAVQLLLAAAGAYSLAAFAAGGAGLLLLGMWGRLASRRGNGPARVEGDAAQVSLRDFLLAFAAYLALIGIVLVVNFVAPVADLLGSVVIKLPFPVTTTALGWSNAATPSYRTLAPLADAGPLLLYAAGIGFVVYRAAGLVTGGSLGRAASRTVAGAVTSSIGVATMIAMALAMTDSGMTYTLARGVSSLAGGFFPFVSPLVGVLGAFMTGSNTSSNILFGALQRDTAGLLGLSVPVILAAQTAGGAIGSMLAPAKIVVGCSTVGLGGKEGPILRAGVKYGLAISAAIGVVTFAFSRLA